jgi:hypothetical protein
MTAESISISWSQVNTRRRCEKKWAYKYKDRLQPKRRGRALHIGNWLHRCLETFYLEDDWKIGHQEYLDEWNKLFPEEQEMLSKKTARAKSWTPLPVQIERIMRSYIWYWKRDGWKIIAVEEEFEVAIGSFVYNGIKVTVYANGRIDLIVSDEEDLNWVVDHKSTGNIPDPGAFHAMNPQLILYPVGIKRAQQIKAAGVIFNYISSKAPSVPQLTKKTGQISRRRVKTDFPTYRRFLKENGYDPADFEEILRPLKKRSPFLKRYKLPREKHVTETILRDLVAGARDIYESQRKTFHQRNIMKDCASFCEFHDLCRGELNGADMSHMRKTMFTIREKKDSGETDTAAEEK